MQGFYYFSNNLCWFQYKNFTEYLVRFLGDNWKRFLEKTINIQANRLAIFNEFYAELTEIEGN